MSVPATVFLGERFLERPEEARVSLFDRGYLFGDSIFETIRAYENVPFAVEAHLDRLEHAAEVTGIAIPRTRAELASLIEEAVVRSALASAYVRVTVSRGEGGSGIGTVGCSASVLSIIVRELAAYPATAYEQGIDSVTIGVRKVPAACLDPAMKTGNYLPNIMARRELERSGLIEGVMLSMSGAVVSGTVSNVFVIEGSALRTPDEASGCRPGVTRAIVLELAARIGVASIVAPVTSAELARADEVFFTNTLMECLPVRQLDGRGLNSVAANSMTRRIMAAYRDARSM